MSKPVLHAHDFEKPFQLATDASDVGVGAVLLQKEEEVSWSLLATFFKKLNIHTNRYSTIYRRNALVDLVLPVQHFEVYLSNFSDVNVFTYDNSLTFL